MLGFFYDECGKSKMHKDVGGSRKLFWKIVGKEKGEKGESNSE